MTLAALSIPAVILVFITGSLLLVSKDWRLSVSVLALQYTSVFILTALSWPLELAAVKLVAGWMCGAILGLALVNIQMVGLDEEPIPLTGQIFRILTAFLSGLIAYSIGLDLVIWLPEIQIEQAIGGLILIATGLVHLGLTATPLRVILGLLTVLSGFEILYAAIERSNLLTGLLALVSLGLALIGAYLLVAPTLEGSE
jgi:hypothetical protein